MFSDSKPMASIWAGRALSLLVVLALLADGANTLLSPTATHAELMATGFVDSAGPPLGLLVLVCVIIYAIPRTSVLGAILLTGFLGGAICTHFRLGEVGSPPQIISLALGVMAWGGLFLRNAHVRNVLPLTD
jgi:hypothetical protein